MSAHVWTGATNTSYNNAGNWTGGIPTAGGDVTFSGSVNCVMDVATAALNSWDMTGYTGVLSSTGNIRIDNTANAVCLFAGGTHTWSGQLLLNPATGTTLSLTSAGKLGNITALTMNGTGTVSLQDELTMSTSAGVLTLTTGAFVTNNYNTTSWKLNLNGGSCNLGTSTLTCYYSINVGNPTVTNTAYTLKAMASGAGLSTSQHLYGTIWLAGGGSCTVTAYGKDIGTLKYTGTAIQTCMLNINASGFPVTNAFIIEGNSAANRVLVYSNAVGSARTITLGASATCKTGSSYVDFQDITLSGGAAGERDLSAITGGSGDCGGNSGITFTTAQTQTWNGTTGNWSNSALWTSRIPLPQDNVIVPNPGAASRTLTADMPRLGKDITVTNNSAANKPTLSFSNQSVTLYGSLTFVNSTYMTYQCQNKSITLAGRNNSILTTAGWSLNTYASAVDTTISKPGAKLSLGDAFSGSVNNIVIASGMLEINYTCTCRTLTNSGVISLGDITLHLVGNTSTIFSNNTAIDTSPGTGNYTIALEATSALTQTFYGGSQTYNNIIITTGTTVTVFNGAFTFANMTMASAGAKTVKFTKSTTYTMSGSNFLSGTAGNIITIDNNDASATNFTLNKTGGGVVSSDYLKLNHSTGTPATTWYAGANSTDDGANTGWTFTAPPSGVTLYAPLIGQNALISRSQLIGMGV